MAVDSNKNTYWTTDDNVKTASLTIDFGKPARFNRFLAQEYIRLGQRVKAFTVEALVDGNWRELAKATTIGYKRILRFPSVTATKVRFNITDAKSSPVISNIGIYNAAQILAAPTVIRDQRGEITIIPADKESEVYYTMDGSIPTLKSKKYTGPVATEGKVQISAMSYEPASGKSSPVTNETFDIPRTSWKLVGIEDEKANAILDGDPSTAWHQGKGRKTPVDLVIDLGKEESLAGFRYLPDQNVWNPAIIANYEFYISSDNAEWKLADSSEFPNVKNNPLWQIKSFLPVKARYIKLRSLRNTDGNDETGYAEVDVITQ
jgi:alpha-L-fucosidase